MSKALLCLGIVTKQLPCACQLDKNFTMMGLKLWEDQSLVYCRQRRCFYNCSGVFAECLGGYQLHLSHSQLFDFCLLCLVFSSLNFRPSVISSVAIHTQTNAPPSLSHFGQNQPMASVVCSLIRLQLSKEPQLHFHLRGLRWKIESKLADK